MMLMGLPLLAVTGCSGDDPAPAPFNADKDCLANGTSSSIGSNHGHTLTVSKTDVENGVQKTYSIQGGSTHDHEVTVTTANFTSLKSNQSIQLTSTSGGGHTHSVAVSCA